MNKFDGVPTARLVAAVELNVSTYRFPLTDKLGLGALTQDIKARELDPSLTESDILRALLRFARGVDVADPAERAKHINNVMERIIDTLHATAQEREAIEAELTARRNAEEAEKPAE
ncbi:hypothetical protein [Nocardia nova]